MSPAPIVISAASDSHKLVDRPNTTVAAPNSATPPNIQRPTCRVIGWTASSAVVAAAPTAVALRKRPSLVASTCNTSWAIAGQQRGRAAEQNGEQVERNGAQHHRPRHRDV